MAQVDTNSEAEETTAAHVEPTSTERDTASILYGNNGFTVTGENPFPLPYYTTRNVHNAGVRPALRSLKRLVPLTAKQLCMLILIEAAEICWRATEPKMRRRGIFFLLLDLDTRTPKAVWIKVVTTMAMLHLGYTQKEIAAFLRLERSTLSYYINEYTDAIGVNPEEAAKSITDKLMGP